MDIINIIWYKSIFVFLVSVSPAAPLSATWTRFATSCYWASNYEDDFNFIKADCEQGLHGKLVKINSPEEFDFVRSLLVSHGNQEGFFVGLERRISGGEFTWEDDTYALPGFWAPGFPDTAKEENCVAMVRQSGTDWRLQDWKCSRDINYICEKPTNVLPTQPVPAGNSQFSRSLVAAAVHLTLDDEQNYCHVGSGIATSRVRCLNMCLFKGCDVFGFDNVIKLCETFVSRNGQFCPLMHYSINKKYYMVKRPVNDAHICE